MVTIHSVLQGTDEWKTLRAGLYTGSNAHKLLRYGATSFSLTEQSSFGGNFYTKRGHILEDEAIELYEAITGSHVERPGFVTNSDYPTCGFSPDGLRTDVLLEVKCFNKIKHMSIYKGDIPLEIQAQIHFGMMICELKQAELLIYNPDLMKGDNPQPKLAFKVTDIPYNRNIQNNFKRILGKEAAHVA